VADRVGHDPATRPRHAHRRGEGRAAVVADEDAMRAGLPLEALSLDGMTTTTMIVSEPLIMFEEVDSHERLGREEVETNPADRFRVFSFVIHRGGSYLRPDVTRC